MKLKETSEVRSGLVLSRRLAPDISPHKYLLLNLRSINADGYITKNTLDIFYSQEPLEKEYLTQAGDIVVRLSTPYTAVLIGETDIGLVISSHFVVIRSKGDTICPAYLYWLLNTDTIKKDIQKNNASNMLGAIRAQYYSNLELQCISRARQEWIGNMYMLSQREEKLLDELKAQKLKYNQLLLAQIQKMRGNKND